MSPIAGLSTALEIAKEVAARFPPHEILITGPEILGFDLFDWKAGVSLHQFSFILDNIIPKWWVWYNRHLEKENPKKGYEYVGSWYDTLSLPPAVRSTYNRHTGKTSHSDKDVMHVLPDRDIIREGCEPTTGSLGVIEIGETHVGYVHDCLTQKVPISQSKSQAIQIYISLVLQ